MTTSEAQDEKFADLAELQEAAVGGVSFCCGAPGTDELKDSKDILLKATTEVLGSSADINGIFQYGDEKGCSAFLTELARFLSQQYGDELSSSQLMVTAGATQGLHLVMTILSESCAPVLVEDPTYFIALRVFQKDLNRNVVPVPSDETGMDLDALDEKLTELRPEFGSEPQQGRFWAVVYLVTVFGNPTGLTYSPAKCQRLIQLARKHNVLVAVDDVYNLLWFPPSLPPLNTNCSKPFIAPSRLLAFDKPEDPDFGEGHVVSLGSFSKYLAPSIRLGWVEAPEGMLYRLYNSGLALSGGSFNHYMAKLVTWALKSGLVAEHVAMLRIEKEFQGCVRC